MAAHPIPNQIYSLEEYLDIEDNAKSKSEYHSGYIVAMAGGSETHSRLSVRMSSILDRVLTECRAYDSNLKLYVAKADRVFYPDAMALFGEPEFVRGRKTIISNPTVIVEVLSSSSERRDRGSKGEYYRSVSSVQHILLVSQDRIQVDHFERQSSDHWSVKRFEVPDSEIRIRGVVFSLADVYDRILP